MKLQLIRNFHLPDFSAGFLRVEYLAFSFTLEDERRIKKVPGETCIPVGTYRIDWQEVITPHTQRYRERYAPWFDKHLHLKDVPGFSGIYIHPVWDDDDTDGCIGPGYGIDIQPKNGRLTKTKEAYKDLYHLVGDALRLGEEVWIDIIEV